MKPQFYTTFWQLSLYDIFVPEEQYKAEIFKLKQQAYDMDGDRTTQTSSMIAKRKKDRERFFNIAARLEFELENQQKNHTKVMERLERERKYWFQDRKCRLGCVVSVKV
jgi:THO complex subunit 2